MVPAKHSKHGHRLLQRAAPASTLRVIPLIAMKRILITGMSGTGKSTVIRELAARGHTAVDTDSDEWCEWRETPGPRAPGGEPVELDWVWREERIQRLLDDAADTLFLSGCKSNQGAFYSQFDHVVLLSAPVEVMFDRIARRTTNPYGKSAEERAQIAHHLEVVEPMLRATSDLEIDTAVTLLDDVVATIIALARDDP